MIFEKTLLLISFLVFSTLQHFAQNVKSGKSYSVQRGYEPKGIPGILKDELLLLRVLKDSKTGFENSFIIDRFDTASLEFRGSWSPGEIEIGSRTLVREEVFIWNGHLCVFYSDFIKEKREYRLLYRVADLKGKMGPEEELCKIPSRNFGIGFARFKLSLSENGKWLTVLYVENSNNLAEAEISLLRFDSLAESSGLTQAQIDFENGKPELIQSITDNDGNFHALFKSQKDLNSSYSLFAFPVFGNEILEYPMEIPGKEIESMRFALDKQDKLFVSGCFREAFEKPGQTSGVFFIRTDRETGKIEANSLDLFHTDLKGLNTGEVKVDKELLKNLNCFALYPDNNGNVLLLADSRAVTAKCETDYRNGLEVCRDLFSSGNLLVLSFDKLANPAWFSFVPNNQSSVDDDGRYLGFMAFPSRNGSLKLVRNTLKETGNRNRPDDFQKAIPVLEDINSNGLYSVNSSDFSLPFPAFTSISYATKGIIYLYGAYDESANIYKISAQ